MNRIKYIDIARGFAMFFIVIGHAFVHSIHCSILCKLLYSFHVVLFFILSGFTFKRNNDRFSVFFKKKFIHIVIPYFIWSVLFLIPYFIFGRNVGEKIGNSGNYNIINNIYNILWGVGADSLLKQNTPLWFLPALFSIEIVYYFIIKIDNKKIEKILIIILPIIGILTYKFINVYLPFGINTLLNIGFFFYYGFLIKEYNIFEKILKFKYMCILFILGVICALCNSSVSCVDYDYGNIYLFYVSSLFLSIFVMYISYNMKENSVLELIGRNTMGILIFHKLFIVIFQTKIPFFSNWLINSNIFLELICAVVISVIAILISLLITKIIRKIFPILIGERNVSNINKI